MQHARGQPGEPAQALRRIQVTQQGRDTALTQGHQALRRGGECQQAHPVAQGGGGTQTDVATTDDQHAFTAEARRQGSERGLV